MNLSIFLVLVALLSVSCGKVDENQGEKQSLVGELSSKILTVGSAAYDTMSNYKLWRAFRRKQKELQTSRLQLQHLYDLRQEKLNRLNGLPASQNVPVKVLPVAIIPQVDNLLAFRPNFHLLDNKPSKINKHQGNLAGNPSQFGGYGGADGYQQTSVGISPSYNSHGSPYTAQSQFNPSTPQGIHNGPKVGYQNQPVGYGQAQGTGYPQAQHSTYAQGTGYPQAQHSTYAQGTGYPQAQHSTYAQGTGYPQAQHSTYAQQGAQGTGYSPPSVQSGVNPQARPYKEPIKFNNWHQELGFK